MDLVPVTCIRNIIYLRTIDLQTISCYSRLYASNNHTQIYVLVNIRGTFFYVRRMVDLMKTAKVNAYIMHIFGKIELLSIHATYKIFKMHFFNDF